MQHSAAVGEPLRRSVAATVVRMVIMRLRIGEVGTESVVVAEVEGEERNNEYSLGVAVTAGGAVAQH